MNKEKLTELVYINLGRASMCWSEIPKGVFDSTKAAELGKEIMDAIEKYVEEDKEPEGSGSLADYLKDEIAKYKDVPTVVVNQESEWQRRKRLEVMKETKMNPNPSHYASRNITVEEIHQIHKEMMENERNEEMEMKYGAAVNQIIANKDYTGHDDNGNPTFRYKGIYYTLDKDFKKILEEKIERPDWWWNDLEPK
jgi:hypothetical protein